MIQDLIFNDTEDFMKMLEDLVNKFVLLWCVQTINNSPLIKLKKISSISVVDASVFLGLGILLAVWSSLFQLSSLIPNESMRAKIQTSVLVINSYIFSLNSHSNPN